jgi:nitrogen fixation protein NifU and related proteins
MNKFGPYSKKVIDHFKNPRNYGKINNPDGLGKVGNPICGDVMWLYIKVGKNKKGEEILKDVKFETFGCVAAISTSSMITDLVKGKTLEEAINVSKDKIAESLDGLPPIKMHCSMLAVDALAEAIYDYLTKNNKSIPIKIKKIHQKVKGEKKEKMHKK